MKRHIKNHLIHCVPVNETVTTVELPLHDRFTHIGLHPSLSGGDAKITHSEDVKPAIAEDIKPTVPEDVKPAATDYAAEAKRLRMQVKKLPFPLCERDTKPHAGRYPLTTG